MNNDSNPLRNVTDVSTVREAFDEIVPFGSTPTGMALDEILRTWFDLSTTRIDADTSRGSYR